MCLVAGNCDQALFMSARPTAVPPFFHTWKMKHERESKLPLCLPSARKWIKSNFRASAYGSPRISMYLWRGVVAEAMRYISQARLVNRSAVNKIALPTCQRHHLIAVVVIPDWGQCSVQVHTPLHTHTIHPLLAYTLPEGCGSLSHAAGHL